MRWLACLLACAGCDALFRVDDVRPIDAALGSGVDGARPSPDAVHDDAPGTHTFCDTVTPTPRFCLDFDQSKYDVGAFTKLVRSNGTIVTTPDSTAESPPNKMVATVTQSAGTSTAFGEYDTNTPYVGTFEFWVRVPNACKQIVASVAWAQQSQTVSIQIGPGTISGAVTGSACTPSTPQAISVTLTDWNHVSIDIAVSSLTVTVAGSEAVTANCAVLSTPPSFDVGTQVSNPPPTCSTELDDVVVH